MVENLIAGYDGGTELVGGVDGHYEQKLRIRYPISAAHATAVVQGNTQAGTRCMADLVIIHINEYGWLSERCKTLKNTVDARDREIITLKTNVDVLAKRDRDWERMINQQRDDFIQLEKKHTDLQDAYAKVGGRSEAALQGEIRRLQEELKVTRSMEAETSRQATQLATILNDANQEKKILREQLRIAREQKVAAERMVEKVREDVRVDQMAQAQRTRQEQPQMQANGQQVFMWSTWW
jgi:hypothetical protein